MHIHAHTHTYAHTCNMDYGIRRLVYTNMTTPEAGCIKTRIKKLNFNATRPVEPRTKNQDAQES